MHHSNMSKTNSHHCIQSKIQRRRLLVLFLSLSSHSSSLSFIKVTHAFQLQPPSLSLSSSSASISANQFLHGGRTRSFQEQFQSKRFSSISAEYDDNTSSSSLSSSTSTSSASASSMTSLGEKVRTSTVAYIDQFVKENEEKDNDEEEEFDQTTATTTTTTTTTTTAATTTNNRQRVVLDVINGCPMYTYDVALPIVAPATASLGFSLNEITTPSTSMITTDSPSSFLSEMYLNMDTLRFISTEAQARQDLRSGLISNEEIDGTIQIIDLTDTTTADTDDTTATDATTTVTTVSPTTTNQQQNGVVVSRVMRGSLAWNSGIRAGDRVIATSATIGDKMWPKSTLDGIRSAISSRKVMSSTVKFQLQRSCVDLELHETEIVQEFELSVSRPMGIHIEDTPDGYVQISGFTDDAPPMVQDKLHVGDRIIAVDSSLGSNLWPVSNVEGAVSAVTTRLPGQPVRLRFERVVEKGTNLSAITSLTQPPSMEENNIDTIKDLSTAAAATITTTTIKNISLANDLMSTYTKLKSNSNKESAENQQLLVRCRDVLKRYMYVYEPNNERSAGVPALVADRVLDSLADASASIDGKTLSLIMNSYMVCKQPKEALRIFEAAVGLAADGTSRKPKDVITGKKGGHVVSNLKGLNLYTATDLIRAHSQLGDSSSARRVLAAIEGVDTDIDGARAFYWNAKFTPDTKCYNTVLAAIANSNKFDIKDIENVYNVMCEPILFNTTPQPKKSVVTYNTMISAYTRSGRRSDAFAILQEMTELGLNPDKYTITSLVKAVVDDGDIDTALTLLRDMKRAGMKADVVGYNIVIRALCDQSQWFEAKTLVADMEARGITPDGKTYGLLMNGLLRLNKPGPCLTLFESACADQRTAGLMENVQLYTTAVTAAASLGDYERALELVSRMTLAGVKPNMKTLTSLLGACLTGENYKYALDVYKRIKDPDGYAIMLGTRAYSEAGEFDTAIEIVDKNEKMTGKQIMSSYNYIISTALDQRDYSIAKKALNSLLSNNFIPSKITYNKILASLDLLQKNKTTFSSYNNGSIDVEEEETFSFLLFVLDAIGRRKLQCPGEFYSCILIQGASLGGLFKKIASLIQQSRSNETDNNFIVDKESENSKNQIDVQWVELFDKYSDYRDDLETIQMPPIRVSMNRKEIRQVLSAEQRVIYNAVRKRKKNFVR